MHLKIINEKYYIYIILVFLFIPINFVPQLFDGVIIDYAFKIGDLSALKVWYVERARHFHLLIILLIDFLIKYTFLKPEILFDGFSIIFLILFCGEVKKYSKFLFGLEKKWCNLAALFTAIFPVWHVLVDFDISTYLISIYFLFFGYRNFVHKKKLNNIIGLTFIVLSFNVESNLCFVIGLAIIHLLINLNKLNNLPYLSFSKLTFIIAVSFGYYFIRSKYFPPFGVWENYNTVSLGDFGSNIWDVKIIKNIFNYSTYLFLWLWIPMFFFLHLLFKNKTFYLKGKFNFSYINNYTLLIILSGFAVFPYLLLNKSSTILYLADYYQRHAFLLAPIYGIFFSMMFRDLSKINCLQKKVNLNYYLITFILCNLILLNYGNLRKIESYLFRKNLTNELKSYGSIPKGIVEFVFKNTPADLRAHEVSYLFYNAYDIAGWRLSNPRLEQLDAKHAKIYIANDYKYECNIYIHLKNDINKFERFKKFYILNYKKYYNIDKVLKKC